jgi:hypothetical protein
LATLFALGCACAFGAASAEEAVPAWQSSWSLDAGFTLSLDTEGYRLPTALAFVPSPGPNPDDPLYYVVELRGRVKVVTRDRTVKTFAEGFVTSEFGDDAPPDGTAEFGAAGICLDPLNGYVFVTFAYQDKDRLLRNDIIRFETAPAVFGTTPRVTRRFTEVFKPFKSGVSHEIGPCQVEDGLLYVSVGDGFDAPQGSQKLDTLLGKIVRMTLDGAPAPGNPFPDPLDPSAASNYVWAYGLRNPFGLKMAEGHLLSADNGLSTDRFLEIRRGENYLWDGTERSMAINVPAVISPSVGPVQLDYLAKESTLFPEAYSGRFFSALSCRASGIMTFHYDLAGGRMLETPRYFMQHVGGHRQMVTGLAFGPDGLYFTPLLPDRDGRTTVLRVSFDPSRTEATLLENRDPWVLLYEKGCYGCHRLGDSIRGGTEGPALDREPMLERLERQLNTPEYERTLDAVDAIDEEPQRSFRHARDEVRRAKGLDRIRTWVKWRVQEPRFDRVLSAMPNMNVSGPEAARITDVLVGKAPPKVTLSARLQRLLPASVGRRMLLLVSAGAFAIGILAGFFVRRRR